jgi:hypothetical protein
MAGSVSDVHGDVQVPRRTTMQVRSGLGGRRAPHSARLEQLRDDPRRGLAKLAELIEAYWEIVLAPYWPRMRSLLEGDVLHRARLLAEGGADQLLGNLDPAVDWDTDTLRVNHFHAQGARRLDGRGLLLVPSVFAWPRVFLVTAPGWQPTLRYPPRGVATL